MSTENANQPAFPITWPETQHMVSGLTKREYFAAMAMNGILASYPDSVVHERHTEIAAKIAVAYADALLTQLSNLKIYE